MGCGSCRCSGAPASPHELACEARDVEALADVVHDDRDLAASIASGSFRVDGMVVAPCSIKVLSGIAHSSADTLIVRAADVRRKERQPLVMLVRETLLHLGHLRRLTAAAELDAVIFPPVPSMYVRPGSVGDLVDHTVMRVCDQLGIATSLSTRWAGVLEPSDERRARRHVVHRNPALVIPESPGAVPTRALPPQAANRSDPARGSASGGIPRR